VFCIKHNKCVALSFKACKSHGLIYNNKLSHPHPQSQLPPLTLFCLVWLKARLKVEPEFSEVRRGARGCWRPWINIDQQRDSPYPPFLVTDSHVTCESNEKYIRKISTTKPTGLPFYAELAAHGSPFTLLRLRELTELVNKTKKSSTQEIFPSW
jgi:hypothetical protein